jgi:hypothetical protein
MGIPSFITSSVKGTLEGEFVSLGSGSITNTALDFTSSLGFDASDYPASLLALPTDFKPPTTNPFQVEMLKTMLTANGRVELFQNPFTEDFSAMRDKLNALIASPSGNQQSDDGSSGANPVVPAATDLLETFTHFERHTDRLCGLVEPEGEEEQELPTLERALAVGASLNKVGQMLNAAPTNAPQLSMFSSFFAGRTQMERLKGVLNLPDSNLIAQEIADISRSFVSIAENDVANYTVGLQKLRRLGVANMVFGSKNNQVEGALFDMITSDYTQGLFAGDDTQRNAEEVAREQRRLDAANNNRANTTPNMASNFSDVRDLFRASGLFEGIAMNVTVYNKLVKLYPDTVPGHFNNYLAGFKRMANPMTQPVLDEHFSSSANKGDFLLMLFRDYLVKNYSRWPTIWPGRGDMYYDGVKQFGSISKILVFSTFGGDITDKGRTDKFEAVIQERDNGPWRKTTESEDAIMKTALATNVGDPLVGKIFLDCYGVKLRYYFWKGSTFTAPLEFPPLPYPTV